MSLKSYQTIHRRDRQNPKTTKKPRAGSQESSVITRLEIHLETKYVDVVKDFCAMSGRSVNHWWTEALRAEVGGLLDNNVELGNVLRDYLKKKHGLQEGCLP